MALEGQLTSFSAKSETIYTNDHPAVIQPLVMDETVLAKVSRHNFEKCRRRGRRRKICRMRRGGHALRRFAGRI